MKAKKRTPFFALLLCACLIFPGCKNSPAPDATQPETEPVTISADTAADKKAIMDLLHQKPDENGALPLLPFDFPMLELINGIDIPEFRIVSEYQVGMPFKSLRYRDKTVELKISDDEPIYLIFSDTNEFLVVRQDRDGSFQATVTSPFRMLSGLQRDPYAPLLPEVTFENLPDLTEADLIAEGNGSYRISADYFALVADHIVDRFFSDPEMNAAELRALKATVHSYLNIIDPHVAFLVKDGKVSELNLNIDLDRTLCTELFSTFSEIRDYGQELYARLNVSVGLSESDGYPLSIGWDLYLPYHVNYPFDVYPPAASSSIYVTFLKSDLSLNTSLAFLSDTGSDAKSSEGTTVLDLFCSLTDCFYTYEPDPDGNYINVTDEPSYGHVDLNAVLTTTDVPGKLNLRISGKDGIEPFTVLSDVNLTEVPDLDLPEEVTEYRKTFEELYLPNKDAFDEKVLKCQNDQQLIDAIRHQAHSSYVACYFPEYQTYVVFEEMARWIGSRDVGNLENDYDDTHTVYSLIERYRGFTLPEDIRWTAIITDDGMEFPPVE